MLDFMDAAFIGIDLAWRGEKNPSGGAVLIGNRQGARLIKAPASLFSCSSVLTYIENHAMSSTIVAIDAPLVIRNPKGQRPCETLVGITVHVTHHAIPQIFRCIPKLLVSSSPLSSSPWGSSTLLTWLTLKTSASFLRFIRILR